MAAALSTPSFSLPSCRAIAPCRGSSFNPLSFSPFHGKCHPLPTNSRKLNLMKAMVLQDKKKIVVTTELNSLPVLKRTDEEPDCSVESTSCSVESPPSFLESWAIKVEQTVNVLLLESVIKILDALYQEREYARFYVLETIARVPYFSFISVLHMYESFGWWRRGDYLKVHFAESWNELHHLLIMEELGGNSWWFDRFLAQHIALFYYFMTVFMYLISPRMAYHFSECVELHAYSSYDKFLTLKGDELKKLPAPEVALKYYTEGDLYLFDEFQTSRAPNTRRPKIENLYDVFVNIRDDEAEHCKTMKDCQTHGNLRSPHSSAGSCKESNTVASKDCAGIFDCLKKSITTPPQEE
ncbi:ubiquinol oxidase 4, chloroplastic/chromoplastic [Nymphaea colorata]|nr:ubiquinol oxidase 4, chloroplastic/chromoplastic [Nymphaea colorata]